MDINIYQNYQYEYPTIQMPAHNFPASKVETHNDYEDPVLKEDKSKQTESRQEKQVESIQENAILEKGEFKKRKMREIDDKTPVDITFGPISSTTGRVYKCNFCSEGFLQRPAFYNHMRSKHYSLKVYCQYCTLDFDSNRSLNQHISLKHEAESKSNNIDLMPYRIRKAFWQNYIPTIDISSSNKELKLSYSNIISGATHTESIMTNPNSKTQNENMDLLLEKAKAKFSFSHSSCHQCLKSSPTTERTPATENEQSLKNKLSQILAYASTCQELIYLQDRVIEKLNINQ